MPIVANALGALTAQVEKPNSLTKIAGIQYDPGILSSVTEPPGSSVPKNKLEKLLLIAIAIAA